jgi:hypothetical protein
VFIWLKSALVHRIKKHLGWILLSKKVHEQKRALERKEALHTPAHTLGDPS